MSLHGEILRAAMIGKSLVVRCQSSKQGSCVIPAQAEIHTGTLDSRLRGNDDPKIKVRQFTRYKDEIRSAVVSDDEGTSSLKRRVPRQHQVFGFRHPRAGGD
ncbi:MAG: hypothetical protein ACK50J_03695, partial [Planctomyces sp.]